MEDLFPRTPFLDRERSAKAQREMIHLPIFQCFREDGIDFLEIARMQIVAAREPEEANGSCTESGLPCIGRSRLTAVIIYCYGRAVC